jgi:hypothetical protein
MMASSDDSMIAARRVLVSSARLRSVMWRMLHWMTGRPSS